MCQTMSNSATQHAMIRGAGRRVSRRKSHTAFTLVEAAMATAVVGLAMAGLLHSMACGDRVNTYGRDLTSAAFLVGEVREFTLNLAFSDPDGGTTLGMENGESSADDIDDLMGVNYCPPIDGTGNAISDLAGWQQSVAIEWVSLDDFTQVVSDGSTNVVRVNVTIYHNSQEIAQASWLKFNGGGS